MAVSTFFTNEHNRDRAKQVPLNIVLDGLGCKKLIEKYGGKYILYKRAQ